MISRVLLGSSFRSSASLPSRTGFVLHVRADKDPYDNLNFHCDCGRHRWFSTGLWRRSGLRIRRKGLCDYQVARRYLGLRGVPVSLLWGPCRYCSDTWTLWVHFCMTSFLFWTFLLRHKFVCFADFCKGPHLGPVPGRGRKSLRFDSCWDRSEGPLNIDRYVTVMCIYIKRYVYNIYIYICNIHVLKHKHIISVCTYVCAYVYRYTYIYICTQTYIHVYTYYIYRYICTSQRYKCTLESWSPALSPNSHHRFGDSGKDPVFPYLDPEST